MADRISEEQRSYNMSRVKGANTEVERLVRKLIHSMGYRFRLHDRSLPGTPDIVFSRKKKAIFVHGCFWHQHDDCLSSRRPKSNQDFWNPKLDRNRERDSANQQQLTDGGWDYLIVWECELRETPTLASRIKEFLG